ncbi:hypothetical protein M404DRAFT_997947 [Pisolithus tinctorius Marx 270]|uniref:Uncharacterized protein n=1 Tax=Pisolithus tinctorius Marx 270 TaxID=870435 RepID=A0A0C3PH76_PISTI|nr:hypothetical protein M404DRAFT_997947 [Pisolithus tinctorius Marx 270]
MPWMWRSDISITNKNQWVTSEEMIVALALPTCAPMRDVGIAEIAKRDSISGDALGFTIIAHAVSGALPVPYQRVVSGGPPLVTHDATSCPFLVSVNSGSFTNYSKSYMIYELSLEPAGLGV